MKPIEFPNLSAAESAALNQALALVGAGAKVTLSVTYKKTTKSKPRVEGQDYVTIPGVAPNVIIGAVSKVALNKKGLPYLLVDAVTRQSTDPTGRGWTCLKPEGIESAAVLRIALPNIAPKTDAMSDELLKDKED